MDTFLFNPYLFSVKQFPLTFLSHAWQSMKIFSLTEEAFLLETTAAILQNYFSKSLDALTKELLKYRQASLKVIL